MSKKSKKGKSSKNSASRTQKTKTTSPAAGHARAGGTAPEARLQSAEETVRTLSGELGLPPLGASDKQSLRRTEKLLEDVKTLEAAVKERQAAVERGEANLAERVSRCADDRKALEDRERALQAQQTELLDRRRVVTDRELELTAREAEAERGFLDAREKILAPVQEQAERLRRERDRLDVELATRRAEAEEKHRAKVRERSARWSAEDELRTLAEAQTRLDFDREMDARRKRELEELRATLRAERERAEEEQTRELEGRVSAVAAREDAVSAAEQSAHEKESDLRIARQRLEAEREMLEEDKSVLSSKVERLVTERADELRHELDIAKGRLEDAQGLRDRYFAELESRRELDRRFGERDPAEVLDALTSCERQRDELAARLRERPGPQTGDRLVELERAQSQWLERKAELESELARCKQELSTRRIAATELEGLRGEKEALKVTNQLLAGALEELRGRVDELTRQDDRRDPMVALTRMDEDPALQQEVRTSAPTGRSLPTLADFACDLRHRIARGVEGRTLYYSERDVRSFLAGMAMSRLILLQGISGTGKTSLPLAFANAVGGAAEVVEVQAGWRDRQELVGYYNAFHRHYYATNFLQALYKAGTPAYRDRPFFLVLDEINLSRPEQFFADFLSALEQPEGSRRITLVHDPVANAPQLMVDGRHLPIPPNVWFVGTANHDETTAEFADKTYDRAHIMELPRKTEDARFEIEQKRTTVARSFEKLAACFLNAQESHARLVAKTTQWLQESTFAETLSRRFRVRWGNRLERDLARYLPVVLEAGGTVGEAMDHLLVTKVLRKLADRHDIRASRLEEVQEELLDAWETLDADNLPERCLEFFQLEIGAKQDEERI